MVAAAHPAAVRAGLATLEKGGNAIDATIAAQMVLNLVEPQSSGIGGGAFLLYWDPAARALRSYDGRETAPAAATEELFAPGGEPMKWKDAVPGGLSVGAPGLVEMLRLAHEERGKLPWADLLAPAIALAETGFAVSPRLHRAIVAAKDGALFDDPAARAYFFTASGEPLAIGAIRKNPAFAATLRAVAADPRAFYEGDIAAAVVAATRTPRNRGLLSRADLRAYRAVSRPPLCAPYRDFEVCGMGPPTSGGVGVLQILGILENFDSSRARAALARGRAFVFASVAAGLRRSRALFGRFGFCRSAGRRAARARISRPPRGDDRPRDRFRRGGGGRSGRRAGLRSAARSPELPSTTHLSIVDKDGGAAAMTSSIESAFGAKIMARGFLLNNQLTDFSFRAVDGEGAPVANRAQPRKRPRSSMSPTMVFRDKKPHLLVGSPGGSRIISYTARAIVAVLDGGMDIDAAVRMPHIVNRNGKKTDIEKGAAAAMRAPLAARGYEINERELTSGLHAIRVAPEGLVWRRRSAPRGDCARRLAA